MHVTPSTLACTEALSVAMYGRYISVGRSLSEPLLAWNGRILYAVLGKDLDFDQNFRQSLLIEDCIRLIDFYKIRIRIRNPNKIILAFIFFI